MVGLAPTAINKLAETLTDSVVTLNSAGNAALCVDSACTTTRAGINFCSTPSPLAKFFFGASCVCGIMGATSPGTALVTSFAGIPVAGWVGSFGARGLNRAGKYTLRMGNVT